MINPYSCDRCNRKYDWTISDRLRAVTRHEVGDFVLALRIAHDSQCPFPRRLVVAYGAPGGQVTSGLTPQPLG